MVDSSSSQYKGIFKTTFLFGFVQLFIIITKVATNKIVATLLGAEGMGIIGIFSNTVNMLKIGAGLGVSQSAVKDISEANASNNNDKFSKTISVTNKVLLITGIIGLLITIIFSPLLSKYTMGNTMHTLSYILLALAVGFGIYTDGQLAILKGMRKLRELAKASVLGAATSLFVAGPLYYFFGKSGIVSSIIFAAFAALFFSNYFVQKIKFQRNKLSFRDVYKEAFPMVKMGMSLMLISFLTTIVVLVISVYIRSEGGIQELGYYNAGTTIMVGYFGIVITSLSTDYYPRIAAVNTDNCKLQDELNKQSAVSLILTGPLMVLFVFSLPFVVELLFSKEFTPSIDYVKIGIFGTLITICSNQVDMILVAKYETKVFIILSVIYRFIQTIITILLYKFYGLIGVGIATAAMGFIHFFMMTTVVYKLYNIRFNKFFVKLALTILFFVVSATAISSMEDSISKYILASCTIILSVLFSLIISQKYFNINIISLVTSRFKPGNKKKDE